MAIENRSPQAGTILYSDHGTQFTSWAFTTRAKESGLLASMGTVADGDSPTHPQLRVDTWCAVGAP